MHMFKMPPMPFPHGRKLVVGLLLVIALAVLVIPSAATPARKIVIYGAHSGSSQKRGLVTAFSVRQAQPRSVQQRRLR